MAESEAISEKKVLEILTQDIQAHRDYVQRLYRNAFYVGGVGLAVGVGMAIWVLGDRLDSSILQHRIDEQLIKKMDALLDNRSAEQVEKITGATDQATARALASITTAASDAEDLARTEFAAASAAQIEQTLREVDQYLSDRLTEEVRGNVRLQIEQLSQANSEDIIRQLTIPAGFVAAFDRPGGCPDDWQDMGGQWRGRTIVAAVSKADDTYAFGRTGGAETHTLTAEEMPNHQHSMGIFIRGEGGGSGYPYARPANGQGDPTSPAGGGHPHNNMPPYIALYICKKE